MPKFSKYSKELKRNVVVETTHPREISELKASGFQEVKPEKKDRKSVV